MKRFEQLDSKKLVRITSERINTLLEISAVLLNTEISLDCLDEAFSSITPYPNDKSSLLQMLTHMVIGDEIINPVRWLYLSTYYHDGIIQFRRRDADTCEISVIFNDYKTKEFTNEDSSFEIDGKNRLLCINLVKLDSMNSLQFPLAPSLTITIYQDGEIVVDRSILSYMSNQPQTQVAVINLTIGDFENLTIKLGSKSPELMFDCLLTYI